MAKICQGIKHEHIFLHMFSETQTWLQVKYLYTLCEYITALTDKYSLRRKKTETNNKSNQNQTKYLCKRKKQM